MTNLFKRFFTHKSKFLLIILCLLGMVFSYSCSCRNDSTGPGNDGNGGNGGGSGNDNNTPAWSFSPKSDTENSYDISFGSKGDKKRDAVVIFYEPDSHEIKKIEIEEVQDPKNILNKDNIQHKNNKQLAVSTEALKSLAAQLTSTDKPDTNKVIIVFKLTSTNATSSDNIKFITNTFNFIKAKKIDNEGMQTLLRSAYSDTIEVKSADYMRKVKVTMHNGDYNGMLETFTLKEDSDLEDGDNVISAEDIKTQVTAYIKNGKNTKDYFVSGDGVISGNITPELQNRGDKISWDVTFKFGDLYESDISKIKIEFTKTKGGWKD